MSLGPFPILLIPSTKNGKLQFWNDLTQEIIEANFSRPNIDDTSGATVMRDGVLIELAENEPDWDDSSGCPVIKMRPQLESIRIKSSNFTGSGGLKTNLTESIVAATIIQNSSPLQLRETAVNAAHAVQITPDTTLIIGEVYSRLVVFNLTANRNQLIISDAGQSNMSVYYNFLTNTEISKGGNVIEYDFYRVGEVIFFRTVWAASGTIGRPAFNLFLSNSNIYLGDVNEGITFHHVGYYPGNVKTTPINTGATTLTRAANAFSFTDLVTKGVLLDNVFSIYFEVDFNNQGDIGTNGLLWISDTGGSATGMQINKNSTQTLIFRYRVSSGTYITLFTAPAVLLVDGKNKIAFSVDSSNLIFSINGSSIYNGVIDLSGWPQIEVIRSGSLFGEPATADFSGLNITPIKLTEAEINADTTL
jgi:hypothetical protein